MAKIPQLPRVLKGLKIAYKQIWGSLSLLTKSRLPFTRDMLVRMVRAPEGCMLPFGKVGTHKWVVFKAIMCAAASCGFRLDEVSDWKFVDGGRSHLRSRWRFRRDFLLAYRCFLHTTVYAKKPKYYVLFSRKYL